MLSQWIGTIIKGLKALISFLWLTYWLLSYFCVKILEKQVFYWKVLGYNDIFFNWTELEGAERYLQGFLCDHQDGFIICPWKQPALNKDQLQCCIYNSFTLPL